MKKIILAFAAVLLLALFIVLGLVFVRIFRPKSSGIYIDSNVSADVIINGIQSGTTPYRNKKMAPGEYSIKILPNTGNFLPFDTKIELAENIETVVRRYFDESEELSSLEMISFEPTNKSETGINIVSIPANAEIVIDSSIRGFTPFNSGNFTAGNHTVSLNLNGYTGKEINFKTHQGYKLIMYVVLSKDKNITPTPTPSVAQQWYIEILDTPTGFLRVRKEPSTVGVEVGQVKPEETYKLIEENVETGWYKIEFKPGIPGWISNQFAKKILQEEPSLDISPTQMATKSARSEF